ncbi:hypothetical protein A1351_17780 [Methylosinus sp. R-45379]|nr:hypothetical protein A1351_17780 [Methylosinus sp. R-45379]
MMIQQGARRNFVYARHLEAANLLHSLVTDAAWPEGDAGSLAQFAARFAPRLRGAIARRTVRGVPSARLHASVLPNLVSTSMSFLHAERAYPLIDEALAWPNRLRGLEGADIVVNYHGNGGSFLAFAKRRGARIVSDFVVTPKYLEIEHEERSRWPGWESDSTSPSVIEFYRKRMSRLVAISDLYLCPSRAVARDLGDLPGFDPARVRLVPYGASGVLLREARPEPGRVLFAGAAGLRKGIPYLAEAARILNQRGMNIALIVAGRVSPIVRARPETQDLVFLGALDRERMAEEFARTDVFCLPSLAEGSATSIYEALANGLPVVTTESSGSVVQDGVEGLIVPERDGTAIADGIARIVTDRRLRAAMSAAALATAQRYSDEACGRTFVAVIRKLAGLSDVRLAEPKA